MAASEKDLITDKISDEIIQIAKGIATTHGAHKVTVKSIISELEVTNRVFYNRFHNVQHVLEIIYKEYVQKMQESLDSDMNIDEDFFGYVMDVATKVLLNTYDIKMQFSQYMFEHDSLTESNREWWESKIKKLFEYGISKNLVRATDPDVLSYSVWCFCRGFNADAVRRKLPRDEAIEAFKCGFGYFLEGMKKR